MDSALYESDIRVIIWCLYNYNKYRTQYWYFPLVRVGYLQAALSRFDPRQKRQDIFFSLCPDRLWGPPSLLYNGYRGSFPRG
jgi:hypothetical protein